MVLHLEYITENDTKNDEDCSATVLNTRTICLSIRMGAIFSVRLFSFLYVLLFNRNFLSNLIIFFFFIWLVYEYK